MTSIPVRAKLSLSTRRAEPSPFAKDPAMVKKVFFGYSSEGLFSADLALKLNATAFKHLSPDSLLLLSLLFDKSSSEILIDSGLLGSSYSVFGLLVCDDLAVFML